MGFAFLHTGKSCPAAFRNNMVSGCSRCKEGGQLSDGPCISPAFEGHSQGLDTTNVQELLLCCSKRLLDICCPPVLVNVLGKLVTCKSLSKRFRSNSALSSRTCVPIQDRCSQIGRLLLADHVRCCAGYDVLPSISANKIAHAPVE